MLKKIIKTLFVILFFTLPLINSHLVDLLWIKWWFYIDWNYEFTKVMFFNIITWLILSLFFIWNIFWIHPSSSTSIKKVKKNKIALILTSIILLLFISTIFSWYIWTSIIWNNTKWHSLIMFLNLIWIFIIFFNQDNKFNKKLIFTTIISSIIVWIIWIREYYFPTFDYWNLSNRALSTFWHPNYLALYILILIPFLIEKNKNKYYLAIFIILFFLLILTKSVWWILIFLIYIWFIIYSKNKEKIKKKYIIYFTVISIIILWIIIYKFWLLTKLNSFISRFYIWETTLKIIFSDLKHFLIWWWIWSLSFIFDSYKVPELYIFENIWFTADRPHNLLLNFFYNFWIFWLIFILYLIYKFIKNYKNNPYNNSILLFLIFTIFNFASITHYLIIILIISIIINQNHNTKTIKNDSIRKLDKNKTHITKNILIIIILQKIFLLIITLITLYWVYLSINYYKLENNRYLNKSIKTNILILNWIYNEETKYKEWYITPAEEYLRYWNLYWENWNKTEAIKNYKKWLNKLPDMWNKNSKYYNNYIIQKLFISERFYSEKFSNLKEVLKRVWEK